MLPSGEGLARQYGRIRSYMQYVHPLSAKALG